MTRHKWRDGVCCTGGSDGTRSSRTASEHRKLSITDRLPRRHLSHDSPHLLEELPTVLTNFHLVKAAQITVKPCSNRITYTIDSPSLAYRRN
jgi:hypothetical protein